MLVKSVSSHDLQHYIDQMEADGYVIEALEPDGWQEDNNPDLNPKDRWVSSWLVIVEKNFRG